MSGLRAARAAALIVLVSLACVVGLIVIGVSGLIDRSDRWPPFGWLAAGGLASGLISFGIAAVVLRARRSGRPAIELARRVRKVSLVAFLASFFAYYFIIAFVYSGD